MFLQECLSFVHANPVTSKGTYQELFMDFATEDKGPKQIGGFWRAIV